MNLFSHGEMIAERTWVRFMLWLSTYVISDAYARLKIMLEPGDTILDVGCGAGITGTAFANIFHDSISGTDIKDVRRIPIPFEVYDGEILPFEDNAYDIVILFFVLHHLDDAKQKALLSEIRRVAKKHVFIAEDTPRNFLERLSCYRHISTYGMFRKHVEGEGVVRSRGEWEKYFEEQKLKVAEGTWLNCFNPRHITNRTIFVIHK